MAKQAQTNQDTEGEDKVVPFNDINFSALASRAGRLQANYDSALREAQRAGKADAAKALADIVRAFVSVQAKTMQVVAAGLPPA